jgi:peptidoglycan hydrolase-like protein with peptidoglycan-binding domain
MKGNGMDIRHVQMVLAAKKFAPGPIDGVLGTKTKQAIRIAAQLLKLPELSGLREIVGVVQACLNDLGFEAGAVDGWEGHNTRAALAAFLHKKVTGTMPVIVRKPVDNPPDAPDIPRQRDVAAFYGQPGPEVKARLTTLVLPFALRLDWNLSQLTNKITVHQKAAPSLLAALIEVEAHYGIEAMHNLGIDRYAGAYNHRKMRGGSHWSMHAYGCAIDFFARPNGLRIRCPAALFCKPDYQPFLDIMEGHGWLPAIRLWGADAMHFQRAKL